MRKLFITFIHRILFAFKMFPTKNPNVTNCKIQSTAYPDGSKHEYIYGCNIKDINKPKVII